MASASGIGGSLEAMLPDELAHLTRWMWAVRPDLAVLAWQDQADELETLMALAVWRAQPLEQRVHALCDALDLERPPVFRSAVAVSDGTWLEDIADPSEWGHAGEGT